LFFRCAGDKKQAHEKRAGYGSAHGQKIFGRAKISVERPKNIDLDQKIRIRRNAISLPAKLPVHTTEYYLARKFFGPDTSVTEDELHAFADLIERKSLQRKEHLLQQGEVSRHFILVESGMLRQYYYKNGKEVTEHFAVEGQPIWCIESLFLEAPTQLLVEVLEDGVFGLVPYAPFKDLAQKHPGIFHILIRMLQGSLVQSQQKADSWKFESARDRYERFLREYPEASKRASINHIASYLLLSPETVSRVRAGRL
jgi:CRP-like cAMP-binding protein